MVFGVVWPRVLTIWLSLSVGPDQKVPARTDLDCSNRKSLLALFQKAAHSNIL
jgi:hypothetical protein